MPVLASSKGGQGKTTVCQALAAGLAGEFRIAAPNADPTWAFSRWAGNTDEGPSSEVIAEPDEGPRLDPLDPRDRTRRRGRATA
jgi:cellulose biosynthesis protein BcsQ